MNYFPDLVPMPITGRRRMSPVDLSYFVEARQPVNVIAAVSSTKVLEMSFIIELFNVLLRVNVC